MTTTTSRKYSVLRHRRRTRCPHAQPLRSRCLLKGTQRLGSPRVTPEHLLRVIRRSTSKGCNKDRLARLVARIPVSSGGAASHEQTRPSSQSALAKMSIGAP